MKKVLVVDNDRMMLEVISEILCRAGCEVKTAEGGLEALDVLKGYIPDFIFLDLIMPNIDGRKLGNIIRNTPELRHANLVVLSAVAVEDETICEAVGACAHIPKGPVEQMAEGIAAVLNDPGSGGRIGGPGWRRLMPREITKELLSVKGHLETILDRMSEGLLEINSEQRILYANPAALNLMRMPEEILLGSSVSDVFNKEQARLISTLILNGNSGNGRVAEHDSIELNSRHVVLNVLPARPGGETAVIIFNDVTKQKEAEKALETANKFLKNILDSSSSISIVSTDLDGNILFWNKGAENLFGYKAEEMVGRRKIGILYCRDEDEKEADGIRKSVLVEKKGIRCVVRRVRKDGKKIWMNLNLTPRFDDQGRLIGMLGMGEDITERRKVEDALRESEEKYRLLAETAKEIILTVDLKDRITYINQAGLRLSGYREAEVLKMNLTDLFPGQCLDAVRERLMKRPRGDKLFFTEMEMVDSRGAAFPMEAGFTPLYRNGRVAGVLITARDITERKRAEEALRDSEERYRILFEGSKDAVVMTDEDGRFIDANQAALDLFGYDREEIKKVNFKDTYADSQDLVRFLDEIGEKRSIKDFTATLLKKNGKPMTCLFSVTAKQADDGRIIGLEGIIRDITDLKEQENALRESERRYMELSITDDLTKLFNLRHFYTQLKNEIERALRYSHNISLLLLDIDDFKNYNDSYGHLEGDKVLAALGRVIIESMRLTDSGYRYGGEEFILILPETDGGQAAYVAERLRRRFERLTFRPQDGLNIHKTVSIGVAEYHTGEEFADFVQRADKAMYKAKQLGKNQVYFLPA